jgi:hypothetical protein
VADDTRFTEAFQAARRYSPSSMDSRPPFKYSSALQKNFRLKAKNRHVGGALFFSYNETVTM